MFIYKIYIRYQFIPSFFKYFAIITLAQQHWRMLSLHKLWPSLKFCDNRRIYHPLLPSCITARASAQLLVQFCSRVSSLMLFRHHFLSIHFYLCPGTHSCSILLSRWSPSPLQKCPKYSSFLLLIFPL